MGGGLTAPADLLAAFMLTILTTFRLEPKSLVVCLLLSVVKIFEKFVSNTNADHLEKCVLFSEFQYGFRSS